MQNYRIKDLNVDEKPREKLLKFGSANLTNEELIAIIIRSGGKGTSAIDLARKILNKYQGLQGLTNIDTAQLVSVKNIDIAKAASIKAAIEIGLRLSGFSSVTNIVIKNPDDVFKLIKPNLFQKDKEHLFMISLNTRNRLISKDLISIGTVNETLLSPREVYKQAFFRNAVSIILVHNHPSNEPDPSEEDIKATQQVAEIGLELGIPLIDHLVVTDTKFISMKALDLFTVKKLNKRKGVSNKSDEIN